MRITTIREVATTLGVRFVAGGSMRRSGDDVRINVELVDAFEGEIVWAGSFDGAMDGLFGLQDAVAQGIVEQFEIQLSQQDNESLNRSETIATEAYDLFLRGWSHYRAGGTERLCPGHRLLSERHSKIEPDFDRARAAIAAVYQRVYLKGLWQESLGQPWYETFELYRLALKESQRSPTALTHPVGGGVDYRVVA